MGHLVGEREFIVATVKLKGWFGAGWVMVKEMSKVLIGNDNCLGHLN